jgi:hypothetical protein
MAAVFVDLVPLPEPQKILEEFVLFKSWATQNFIRIKTSWNTNN